MWLTFCLPLLAASPSLLFSLIFDCDWTPGESRAVWLLSRIVVVSMLVLPVIGIVGALAVTAAPFWLVPAWLEGAALDGTGLQVVALAGGYLTTIAAGAALACLAVLGGQSDDNGPAMITIHLCLFLVVAIMLPVVVPIRAFEALRRRSARNAKPTSA